MSPGTDHISQLIDEAIKTTKDLWSALLQAYASSNTKQIDNYLPLFDKGLGKLELVYSASTRPPWITAFRQLIAAFSADDNNAENIRRGIFVQLL